MIYTQYGTEIRITGATADLGTIYVQAVAVNNEQDTYDLPIWSLKADGGVQEVQAAINALDPQIEAPAPAPAQAVASSGLTLDDLLTKAHSIGLLEYMPPQELHTLWIVSFPLDALQPEQITDRLNGVGLEVVSNGVYMHWSPIDQKSVLLLEVGIDKGVRRS